jgi:hypothetical protein
MVSVPLANAPITSHAYDRRLAQAAEALGIANEE